MHRNSPLGELETGATTAGATLPAPVVAAYERARAVTALRHRTQRRLADLRGSVSMATGHVAAAVAGAKVIPEILDASPITAARLAYAEAEDAVVAAHQAEAAADHQLTTVIGEHQVPIRAALRTAMVDLLSEVRPIAAMSVAWDDPSKVITGPPDVRAAWETTTAAVPRYEAIRRAIGALAAVVNVAPPPEFKGDPGRLPKDPRARLVKVSTLDPDTAPWLPEPSELSAAMKAQGDERRARNGMVRAGSMGAVRV